MLIYNVSKYNAKNFISKYKIYLKSKSHYQEINSFIDNLKLD